MKPLAYLLAFVCVTGEVRCDPSARDSEKLPAPVASENFSPAATEAPIMLDKVTVYPSKQFDDQLWELGRLYKPKAAPPFLENGRMFQMKIGGKELDIGAKQYDDLFKESAKYKDKTPMIRIDLLHLHF